MEIASLINHLVWEDNHEKQSPEEEYSKKAGEICL